MRLKLMDLKRKPHCRKKSKIVKSNLIPLTHIYMTAHFPGLE